jgi:hypothetical protein
MMPRSQPTPCTIPFEQSHALPGGKTQAKLHSFLPPPDWIPILTKPKEKISVAVGEVAQAVLVVNFIPLARQYYFSSFSFFVKQLSYFHGYVSEPISDVFSIQSKQGTKNIRQIMETFEMITFFFKIIT